MATNAYLDSFDVFCSECFNNRADTIVPATASCFTESDFPEFHIEIIRDDDDVFGLDFEKCCTGLNAFTREIHVGFRFEEDTFTSFENTRSIESLISFFPFFCFHLRSEVVHKKKPDIVSSFSVFFSWISETDDELHGYYLEISSPISYTIWTIATLATTASKSRDS